jgi:large subunit ribosomal protein L7/L12
MADDTTKTPEDTKSTLSSKLEKIAKEIEGLTVLEMSELAGYLEEKFGVSAMPMMAAAPAAGGAAATGEPAEEKTSFDVVLTDAGANKLAVIKAVREIKPDLGLMDAKKLVETAPQALLSGVKKEEADGAKKKIEDAGGKVELK